MNKYDYWIIGLMLAAFALFMLCASVQTSGQDACRHSWADAGVRLTIVRLGAKPVQYAGLEAKIVITGRDTLEWYGLGYYKRRDLEPYQMQYCQNCGLLRIIKED